MPILIISYEESSFSVKKCLKRIFRLHSTENYANNKYEIRVTEEFSTNRTAYATIHQCNLCMYSTPKKSRMQRHMLSHRNIRSFTCNECGQAFLHKHHLQAHLRVHTGEKQFKCDICGQGYTRREYMERHKTKHLNDAS
ncbi:hypothetical protein CEXT_468971 [Caerostris extrusa]|uniref:C2H2-type domain-containing protein n=1 Tax=Caerostris extrusa TaxID=172846 RepID=A0AAV4MYE5_CAEEX|nr:hypothetical protein CEXT_468971 [Caerostris extrusa]